MSSHVFVSHMWVTELVRESNCNACYNDLYSAVHRGGEQLSIILYYGKESLNSTLIKGIIITLLQEFLLHSCLQALCSL